MGNRTDTVLCLKLLLAIFFFCFLENGENYAIPKSVPYRWKFSHKMDKNLHKQHTLFYVRLKNFKNLFASRTLLHFYRLFCFFDNFFFPPVSYSSKNHSNIVLKCFYTLYQNECRTNVVVIVSNHSDRFPAEFRTWRFTICRACFDSLRAHSQHRYFRKL